MENEFLFLDIGDILTIENRTRDGNDFDEYKIKLLNQILKSTNFNIVWISSWIRNDDKKVIDSYLREKGFKLFDRINGPVTNDLKYFNYDKFEFDAIKLDLIKEYNIKYKPIKFLVIDSDPINPDSNNFLALTRKGLDPINSVKIIQNYKKGIYNVID